MSLPDFNLSEAEIAEIVAATSELTRISCVRSSRFAQTGDHSSLVARRKGTEELEARKRVEAAIYGPTVRRIKEIRVDAKF